METVLRARPEKRWGSTYKFSGINIRLLKILLIILAIGFKSGVMAQGTWQNVANTSPYGSGGLTLLLSDGTVMAKSNSGLSYGNAWMKLTPDASGSYANGTWTTLAPMTNDRLYFSSQVLKDGRVYVAGGEYGAGGSSGEVYNPVTNTWTAIPDPGHRLSDANSEILPDGRVLQAAVEGSLTGTLIYDPATNQYTTGPTALGIHNESVWVKLADNSILYVDRLSTNSERYIPSLNQWVADATVPVNLYDPYGDETGAAVLLPNGKALFIGSMGYTAIYTPSGTSSPGTWTAGPLLPDGQGQTDAPAAMMANGKVLIVTGPTPVSGNVFQSPTSFYEYDYVTNSYTRINAPNGSLTENHASFVSNLLQLPDGSVLYSVQGSNVFSVYTPSGTPLAAGKPTITQVSANRTCGNMYYSVSGTGFNGISEGASYGDDWQMNTNYPLVRLTNGSSVYYARTYDWNSTGVARGAEADQVKFILPSGLPEATYSLVVTANGISSDPVSFTYSSASASQCITIAVTSSTSYLSNPTIPLTVNVSTTNTSISKVDYYDGTTLIGTATTAPFTYTWNNVSSGSHSITAKATDNLGIEGVSAAVTITVNYPPTVVTTSPADSSTVVALSTVTWRANPSDVDGTIAKVDFYLDGALYITRTASPYSLNIFPSAGNHILTAVATDNQGDVGSSTVHLFTTPVTISLTSPANGTSYLADPTISLTVNVSTTNTSITKVDYYDGATLIGTATTAPFSYSWNNVNAGTHSITAKATDNLGKTGTSAAVSITVNHRPTVVTTSPSDSTTVVALSYVTWSADASDVDGTVAKVDFYLDGALYVTRTTSPYSLTYYPNEGTHSLTAVATDNQGDTSSSTVHLIATHLNQPPSISMTSPADYSLFYAPASIPLGADATDSDGTVVKVVFQIGGTILGIDSTAPYTFNWTNVAPGTYSVYAGAYDNNGAYRSSSYVHITVDALPVVNITSPSNNSTFIAPADVTITATATDSDGTISKVDFYNNDTTLLGTSTVAPYSLALSGLTAGSYSVTAKATDDKGGVGISSPVVFNVIRSTPNLALHKTGNASSIQNAGLSANYAFDGDYTNTRWSSIVSDTQWIYVDLGATYSVFRSKITWENAYGKDYKIQISSDTTNWVDLKTVTGNTTLVNDWAGLSGTGRYVRMYGTARGSAYGYSIYEFEVYGDTISNVAPVVSVTSPTNNSVFNGPVDITITASASDADGSVVKVEFYNGATLIGTATSAPYSYTWTSVTGGSYSITAKATDNLGGVATSAAINITVNQSNQSPTTSITSPSNNSVFTAPASITISASASDVDGSVAKVDFYNGATFLGTSTTAPYTYTWTGVIAGTYSITAKATDNLGAVGTSTVVSITVNTGTSSTTNIALNKPAFASSIENGGAVATNAVDGDSTNTRWSSAWSDPQWIYVDLGATYSVDRVKIIWENAYGKDYQIQIAPDTTNWVDMKVVTGNNTTINDWTGLSGTGRYVRMYGTARGTGYGYSIYELQVYGNQSQGGNQSPVASITSPSNNSVFTAPADITITASASDADGSVAKVDFYNGTTLLGTSTVAPYTYTWAGVVTGTYSITAKATDNQGAVGTSSAISITVNSGSTSINLALNKPAFASSNNGGNVASLAVDGDSVNTRWESAWSDPQWIYVDLGATYSVDRVKIVWENAFGKDYQIQIAPDTTNWVDMKAVTGNSTTVNDWTGLSGTGRYIRVYGTARATGYGYSIYELQVYGSQSQGGNQSPVASITSPSNNSVFTAPASISITASASDADGSVAKVDFYNGTTLLGTSTIAPYTYTWTGVVAGTYSITAKATDNQGAVGTSSVVTISVSSSSTNLALNKPAYASSLENGGTTASNAVDGDATNTRWSSAWSDPQWIYVDLGATYSVDRVKITWENAFGKDYQIQIAPDTTNWVDMKVVTGNSTTINDWTGLSGTGRYVRIYGTARATGYGYSIYELEVYGTPAAGGIALKESFDQATVSVSVYPNPASDEITVSCPASIGEGLVHITMMNAEMKEVLSLEFNNSIGNNFVTIPVSHLPAGLYILQVQGVSLRFNQRVVVTR